MSGVVSDAKSKGADATTSTEGLVWLRHELVALKKGKWPKPDWNRKLFSEDYYPEFAAKAGQQLCGGYRFALWQVIADLDYLCNYLQLKHYGSKTCCFKCKCNRSDAPCADLTPSAVWRQLCLHNLRAGQIMNISADADGSKCSEA